LCKNVDVFKSLDVPNKIKVKVANDEFLNVKGKGSIVVSTTSYTKVIPNISQNLLSVR